MAYPFRIAAQLQYIVKSEKCKGNDVIFPSGCEAQAINLGNTGGTSVRFRKTFSPIFLDIQSESMK